MGTLGLHQRTGNVSRHVTVTADRRSPAEVDSIAKGEGDAQTRLLYRIGFWAAVVAIGGAGGYVLSAFLQIMHLASDLNAGIIGFTSSLLIPVPFLLAMLVLDHTVPEAQRFWTHTAVVLAGVYTTYNTLNYVVQLATVIPAGYSWNFDNQQGTQGPLALLNQTPHSLFWDVDALGYVFLSLATLAASFVFNAHGLERWVRRSFQVNALIIPLFCTTYFYPGYSVPQLMFGLPWGIAIPASLVFLARFFRSKIGPPNALGLTP
jgi:hypothetical protein